jgi:molybdopterin-dependent oxidoreductase alpha subunit
MAVNAASNAPRMLTALADAHRRGAQIVHVNPLVEAASRRTIVPHEFVAMAAFHATATGTMDVQPRIGGDLALLRGVAKAALERAMTDPSVIDGLFIERYTANFEAYRNTVEAASWAELTHQSGVPEKIIRDLADRYLAADRTIIAWCLGLTQQEHGCDTVREILNLLMLRGNLGREGAGPTPIRGHSNVQGNRTCGIDHRPTEDWLARLDAACGIRAPREHGLDTVSTIRGMLDGSVRVFVSMGGNFALAAPDTEATFAALRNTDLTVQVSTKLNRSHLVHGRAALILPCLGRTERDVQRGGEQGVSVEDSMSMVHISYGMRKPPSPALRSECAILAGMARATLPDSATPWEYYVEDYDRIRDTMAKVLVGFEDFNRRVRLPLGFRIRQPARERVFLTPSGRAEFVSPPLPDVLPRSGKLMLSTMRSHDQWNTTIYSDDDRYRGVSCCSGSAWPATWTRIPAPRFATSAATRMRCVRDGRVESGPMSSVCSPLPGPDWRSSPRSTPTRWRPRSRGCSSVGGADVALIVCIRHALTNLRGKDHDNHCPAGTRCLRRWILLEQGHRTSASGGSRGSGGR